MTMKNETIASLNDWGDTTSWATSHGIGEANNKKRQQQQIKTFDHDQTLLAQGHFALDEANKSQNQNQNGSGASMK